MGYGLGLPFWVWFAFSAIRLIPGPTRRKKHKLKIMTVNCCSLRSTGKRLAALLHEHQPDIVCGTESHLENRLIASLHQRYFQRDLTYSAKIDP